MLSIFVNLYTFRATIGPSSGEKTVFATLGTCYSVWLTVWYAGCALHTTQSSTQNNKYQASQKHSCFSWWWACSRPKRVEIDKYTKHKFCTKLVLFAKLYGGARSTKHKIYRWLSWEFFSTFSSNFSTYRVQMFNVGLKVADGWIIF